MLYIHRKITQGTWGVIDTDDWSETEVCLVDLRHYVEDLGVDIKGVSIEEENGVRHVKSIAIFDRNVQGSSALVAKIRALCDVAICVDNGYISSISLGAKSSRSDVRVRLSEVGHCLGYHALGSDWRGYEDGRIFTVVLDDKLDYVPGCLYHFWDSGIHIDIRELTREDVIEELYLELARMSGSSDMSSFLGVDDEPERFDKRLAEYALSVLRGYTTGNDPPFRNRLFASKYAANKYGRYFIELVDMNWSFSDKRNLLNFCPDTVLENAILANSPKLCILESGDYRAIRGSCFGEVFDVMMRLMSDGSEMWGKFRNYVNYFEVPVVLQKAFVKLCERSVPFIKAYYSY